MRHDDGTDVVAGEIVFGCTCEHCKPVSLYGDKVRVMGAGDIIGAALAKIGTPEEYISIRIMHPDGREEIVPVGEPSKRMINYNWSAAIEFGALQSKTPYVGPMAAIERTDPFEPTDADIDNLAVCLMAAWQDICFSTALGILEIGGDLADRWRRVARAAFDHPGYLPSIEAARNTPLTRYDISTGERVLVTQAHVSGMERALNSLCMERDEAWGARDALAEQVAILDRGRAEVFAEIERCHAEIAALQAHKVAYFEHINVQAELFQTACDKIATKDARIAELKSRLACEQTESDKDADKAANAGPVGGVWPAGAAKPLPDSASESPRAHNPFRDFGGDRRRIGG